MGDRLCHFHSQDILLCHSFSIPNTLYILCAAPCFLSPNTEAYDNCLRNILSDVINVRLNGAIWSQVSLLVRAGGIGICRAAQLAPSAFLASAAGYSELTGQILPHQMQDISNPMRVSALIAWQQGHDQPAFSSLATYSL